MEVTANSSSESVSNTAPGMGRLSYFLCMVITAITANLASNGLGKGDQFIIFAILVILLPVQMAFIYERLINIEASPWWTFLWLVPGPNLILGLCCLSFASSLNRDKKAARKKVYQLMLTVILCIGALVLTVWYVSGQTMSHN